MNTKTAKEIRKILNYDPKFSDETQKRVYCRAKKQYSQCSAKAKRLFLQQLKNLYNN